MYKMCILLFRSNLRKLANVRQFCLMICSPNFANSWDCSSIWPCFEQIVMKISRNNFTKFREFSYQSVIFRQVSLARVKLFYVACSKNCFLPWTMEMIRGSCWLSFRSTSNSGISSGALLVVIQCLPCDICFPPFRKPNTERFCLLHNGVEFLVLKWIQRWPVWNEATSLAASFVSPVYSGKW